MTIENCRNQIIATLAEMGQVEDARRQQLLASGDDDLDFVELEMDSLTALDFCVNLEDALKRTVEPADLIDHPSLNALARHLANGAKPA